MGPLRCISNLGMRISKISSALNSTSELKKTVPVTCSTDCGFQTCLWNELKRTDSGPSCVRPNAQVSQMSGATSSEPSTSLMKLPESSVDKYRPKSSGKPSWTPKSKPEPPISATKTQPTPSPINKTLELSALQTYARKSLSSPVPPKPLSATSVLLLSLGSLTTASLILLGCANILESWCEI